VICVILIGVGIYLFMRTKQPPKIIPITIELKAD